MFFGPIGMVTTFPLQGTPFKMAVLKLSVLDLSMHCI